MLTPRERAVVASRAMPARTSPDSQCCGSPFSALLASLISLTESISSRAATNDSSRGQGRLATSPPETTTSRTPDVRRR